MASESTYTSMSTLVNSIWETAFLTASEAAVMPSLVRVFSDSSSSTPRKWASYTGGTVDTVTEATDMSAQTFTPAAAGTLTPAQVGLQYFLTDQRIASDPFGAQRDAGADLGRVIGVSVDTNLVGLFASLTGGTVGTAGGTITWANVQRAAAYLRAQYADGEIMCVLRPEQWYYLTSASSGVPTLMQSPAWMDSLARNFYTSSWGNINFFIDANITSGTAAVAGMFVQDAMAYDLRRALRIESQRDASRAGGGYELNATMIYAYGITARRLAAR